MNSSSDILQQAIDRRFDGATSANSDAVAINNDFYMDVLSVFHAPERFDAEDFQKYPVEVILDYLRRTHGFYLTKNLPELDFAAATLAKREPRLVALQETILSFFTDFRSKLEKHISEEESQLFPYLDMLIQAKGNDQKVDNTRSKLIDFMVHHSDDLEDELNATVKKMEMIAEGTKDSFALKMMITRLTFFELDLRIHGRLEDEVLMPLALQLEKDVVGSDKLRY
ncbi:MAG: hemerythrin domain-containing protein [Cyclobacteriaceae bacterium]